MPFNVSEEQSLLTSMITERDTQISTLTHQLHSTSEILHSTQKELQSKSNSRKAQREEHSATIKKLKEEHTEQRRILAKFEQNVKNGGGLRVHEYAALMRSANSSQVESSYVIRLQAQLCRAMHSLGVMESQLALVKENCSSLIKFMKEDLSHMVDDRTRREIELMNGLAKVDNEKRVMAEEMEQKIQEKEELLDQVREEYEELGLEYDENEVKRALEVKYLLEQMDKVQEDKVRLERELLAALLEREERINKLRVETEELGIKLEGLKKDVERRDIRSGDGLGVAEDIEDGDHDNGEAVQDDHGENDAKNNDEGGEVEGEQGTQEQETIADVTSQLENTNMNETPSAEEVEPTNEDEEGSPNDGESGGDDQNDQEERDEENSAAVTAAADAEDAKAKDSEVTEEAASANGDSGDAKAEDSEVTEEAASAQEEPNEKVPTAAPDADDTQPAEPEPVEQEQTSTDEAGSDTDDANDNESASGDADDNSTEQQERPAEMEDQEVVEGANDGGGAGETAQDPSPDEKSSNDNEGDNSNSVEESDVAETLECSESSIKNNNPSSTSLDDGADADAPDAEPSTEEHDDTQ